MSRRLYIAVALGMLCLPFSAKAGLFYELNPDLGASFVRIATSPTAYEIFIPQNDYLGGFDFWVSNAGQAGQATFNLYNSNNVFLAGRTVTIPAIADTANGQRFHVNLLTQLPVASTNLYRIRISSAIPTLRLYYVNRIKILPHNAPYTTTYKNGVALLGTEEQNYSFKFALYENQESLPPIISGNSARALSTTQALVEFNANEPVDFKIDYGLQGQSFSQSIPFSGGYTFCASGVDICQSRLTVLPASLYGYQVTVKDEWGNQSIVSGTFETPADPNSTPTPTPSTSPTPTATPPPDTTKPVISNFRVVDLSDSRVGLAWETNEAANSFLLISLYPILITQGSDFDSTLELQHYLEVGGLTRDTFYFAKITSADSVGNSASASLRFTSLKAPVATPTPSNSPPTSPLPTISVTPSPSPGLSEITWSPPSSGEPNGGYRIDIFDGNNQLIRTIDMPAGTHQAYIPSAEDDGTRAIVYANDDGVNKKVAPAIAVSKRQNTFLERLFDNWPYFLGIMVAFVGILLITAIIQKRKKPAQPPAPKSTTITSP